MFGRKAKVKDVNEKIEDIRALGKNDDKKKRGKKGGNSDEGNFYALLNYLGDENPECRIAAAEEVGKTTSDVAITYLVRYLAKEEDEKVASAMKTALASIKSKIHVQ